MARQRNFIDFREGMGLSGEGDAGDVLEVVDEGDVVPVDEQSCEGLPLAVADFEGEEAVGFEGGVGLGDEAAVDVEAVGPAKRAVGGSWSRTWGWRVSRSESGT